MKRLFIFLCTFFVLILCAFYGKMVDNRTNSEKLKDIQWTKENLEKWKFVTGNNQTKMKFDNISIVLQDENLDCTESESGLIRSSHKCRVTKINQMYIYWTITEYGIFFQDA